MVAMCHCDWPRPIPAVVSPPTPVTTARPKMSKYAGLSPSFMTTSDLKFGWLLSLGMLHLGVSSAVYRDRARAERAQ